MEILPGVREACDDLRRRGYLLVVVTNQPDIARGTLSQKTLDGLHARLRQEVQVDSIWVCPHDDADHCSCRKPAPGLILRAAEHHGIDLSRSYAVGDRWRDIEAGRSAACRTIFVDREYDERRPAGADATVGSLPEAVDWIVKSESTDKTDKELANG
jgi:D-glycero-D-manno-heptose 1,7-bisphosphate phosphatase